MDLQGVMKQLEAWEHLKDAGADAPHGAGDNSWV